MGFSVLKLDDAVKLMQEDRLPPHSLVLTVDDGWQGVENIAWPLLRQYGFDWTLYVTTYYVEKQLPVNNILLLYLFWKTTRQKVDFSDFTGKLPQDFVAYPHVVSEDLVSRLVRYADSLPTAVDRQAFVNYVAIKLGLDPKNIEQKRLFYLIDQQVLYDMHRSGVDIQLHTHRHNLGGVCRETMFRELRDNRDSIAKICSHRPTHFCYPSGFYKKEHLEWLSDWGMASATTCKAGLNYPHTNPLELNRFLDGENISEIEFEAELSGFAEVLRYLKNGRWLVPWFRKKQQPLGYAAGE
ncbi:polysaccharide deacetylase family protein [Luteithermobacter gelatinilyticus]|uniref:polysaccharide deacetylase family protein n=1 Tax=Luteithermobacter gelatinilyticus TaxID=2582913 RepID=UPI001105959D|nr:polysaccharide deacetylase family protein [Luteithermobacter gelatinilyticus]